MKTLYHLFLHVDRGPTMGRLQILNGLYPSIPPIGSKLRMPNIGNYQVVGIEYDNFQLASDPVMLELPKETTKVVLLLKPTNTDALQTTGRTVIEVTERLHDWTTDGSGREHHAYHTQLRGQPGIWGRGLSQNDAIGDLIRSHHEKFNIEVVDLGKASR